MFWIGTGSFAILFFSIRTYLNNNYRWRMRKFPRNFSTLFFYALQGINIILIISAFLFLMLAIVCYIKGFQIRFSSAYAYQMKILAGKS